MTTGTQCNSSLLIDEVAGVQVAEAAKQPAEEQQEAAAAADPDILSQEMLRKYITFAKDNCFPKLANADYEKISQASVLCSILPCPALP